MNEKIKHFLILLLILTGVQFAHAQVTVSGRVFDAKTKQPLVGASVSIDNNSVSIQGEQTGTVQNISIGAVTDKDGKFSFKSPINLEGKRVVISYMGYVTQRLTITDNRLLTIYLEEDGAVMLQDIVLTGYQSINRKKSTGAIVKIKTEDIKQAGVMGVDQMLTGQLAGVVVSPSGGAPGAASQIRIRGNASISGVQEPLWVIDGIPLETNAPKITGINIEELQNNSIAGINPNDIENITILKDAAATAIYGARAANGVIVITTKSGKKGDRLNVSYRSSLSYTAKPDISRLNLLNSTQKLDLELDLFKNNYSSFADKGAVSTIMSKYGVTPNDFASLGYGGINANARNDIEALRQVNTNWNNELFKAAYTQEHALSLSGGSDKATYYFSGGYYDENGATKGTNAKRYTLNAKGDFDIFPKVKLTAGIMFNQRNQGSFLSSGGVTNPVYYSRIANPYQSIYNADGSYAYDKSVFTYNDAKISDFNTLEERENTSNDLKNKALNTNLKLAYQPITGLTLSSQLGVQSESSYGTQLGLANSFYVREQLVRRDFLPQGGIMASSYSEVFQYTLKNLAEYEKTFKEKHQLSVMLGNELRRNSNTLENRTQYGYDPDTRTFSGVVFPSESDANSVIRDSNKSSINENSFVSFFANSSYTYDYKYTLSASLRFDGSNLFGVDPKYKYLPLWSVGGLWRLREESFMAFSKPWLDEFNIRASYGLQGNIDKSTSPYLKGFYKKSSVLPGTDIKTIELDGAPNSKLRWEKTENINVGVDLAFLNSRVRLGVDYYERKGHDLINMKSLPQETGFSAVSINWAEMNNKGVEVNLSTVNVKLKDFEWRSNFNIAYNKNTVLKEQVQSISTANSREGYPVGSVFLLPYGGMSNKGDMQIVNPDGSVKTLYDALQLSVDDYGGGVIFPSVNITNADYAKLKQYQGSTDPLYSGGFNNTFKYTDFELNVGFIYNLGHIAVVQPYYNFTNFNRGLNTTNYILNRWTPTNLGSNLPGIIDYKDINETLERRAIADPIVQGTPFYSELSLWKRKADYVRLRNVSLAYNLPKKWCSKLALNNVKFIFEARNLWVWGADYSGYLDPESLGNPYAQPMPKTYTLGLNVNF